MDFIRVYLEKCLTDYGVTASVKVANISKAEPTDMNDGDINITLLHIEEERTVKEPYSIKRNVPGQLDILNSEVKLNLYIIVSSEESTSIDYTSALKRRSYAIVAFQEKNHFIKAEIDAFESTTSFVNGFVFDDTSTTTYKLERLTCDLHTLTLDQSSNIWQAIRGKVVPNVVYKLRLIALRYDRAIRGGKEVLEININASGV